MDDTPLATAELWPSSRPRWAWGQDAFGRGGFGYDGFASPGMGNGAFGAGMFGMDAELLNIEAILSEDGIHRMLLRTVALDGRYADAPEVQAPSSPPPPPPTELVATGYDKQNDLLTVEWA